MDQGIKSRPRYSPLRLDPAGQWHLFLTDLPAFPPQAMAAAAALDDAGVELWVVAGVSTVSCSPFAGQGRQPGLHAFRSRTHLLGALEHRLARERMGLRLYGAGREGFLWDVFRIADAAGMGREEVFLNLAGSQARRVYCVHCRSVTEGVRTNVFTCTGCGANLFVRDHFSRRMAAFMGVQVDAEQPGEIPAVEEHYP